MPNQNKSLINNSYTFWKSIAQFILRLSTLLCNIKCPFCNTNPHYLLRMPEILSLSPLPATGIFSSVKKSRQTFVCLLGALYEDYFEFHTATPIPLLASTLWSSTKNAAEYPLSKTCFSPENHAVFMSRKYTSKMQMAAVCALGY